LLNALGQRSDFPQRTESAACNCKSTILQRLPNAIKERERFGSLHLERRPLKHFKLNDATFENSRAQDAYAKNLLTATYMHDVLEQFSFNLKSIP
jgi:hypothetical protein